MNVSVLFITLCVGHLLADQIPLKPNKAQARDTLGLNQQAICIALLPGSRHSELNHLALLFIETAKLCLKQKAQLKFIAPMANEPRRQQFQQLLQYHLGPNLHSFPIQLLTGQAQLAMAAADAVLVTSGTATLEAMLVKTPMVVAYRWHPISHALISPLVQCSFIALPNLLAGKPLVPELLQQNCQPPTMATALLKQLESHHKKNLLQQFTQLHQQLKRNASKQAAQAISQLLMAQSMSN